MMELTPSDLELPRFLSLVKDLDRTYYWSQDFSPEFYRLQAQRGFIAISTLQGGETYLLPELQQAYAVLDWENLNLDPGVQRILKQGRLDSEYITLRFNPDPSPVLDALEENWGERSWLHPPYRHLMETLAAQNSLDFALWGVELRWGDDQLLAAGELGYTIGAVYTSLTGFLHRRLQWNHFGKLQLVLLARQLQSRGFAFHNLGHPYMDYKLRLGARILPRVDFLQRWVQGIQQVPVPGLL